MVKHLKAHHRARRATWPPDTFIFRQVPADIPESTVHTMQSLSEAVKTEFAARFVEGVGEDKMIHYRDQVAVVDAENVIRAYCPSIEDVMGENWILL